MGVGRVGPMGVQIIEFEKIHIVRSDIAAIESESGVQETVLIDLVGNL